MSVKGLRKMIYPFAPDQSGAVSVLYELGGMVIICDAGGCAGNVCGFDEPRWLGTKSAVFSAGLRDMDAILGRDDLLIDKISKAAEKLEAKFVAIIGTPVPATIATDYRALKRMAEKRTGLPVITVDSNGAKLYDEGEEKAYLELFRRFAADAAGRASDRDLGDPEVDDSESIDNSGNLIIPGSVGVIGATPLDFEGDDLAGRIAASLEAKGVSRVICYGIGSSLEDVSDAGFMEKNIVVSPAGIRPPEYLKERFGTPYEIYDPLAEEALQKVVQGKAADMDAAFGGRKVLIIHQQVRANTIRDIIEKETDAEVTAASWFMMSDTIRRPGDIHIREEEDFFDLAENGGYDVIIADGSFRKPARGFAGTFIEMPHFAVSGV